MSALMHEGRPAFGRNGQYCTGLLLPSTRPLATPPLRDSVPNLSRSDIEDIIHDPKRVSGREIFDQRYIKHQRNRNSCNGFAGAKALERSRVLQGMPHVALSGEGLYAQVNDNRDRGSGLQEGMEAMIRTGIPPEDMVPSQEIYWRNLSEEARQACSRFRASECYRVDTEEELATGIALGFVGVVAVHVTSSFHKLDGNGLVYPTSGVGNHAVGIDDVKIIDGEYAFDMFNSWGTSWGDNGRGLLTWRRHLRGPIRYHAYYLIRAATIDPKGEHPPKFGGDSTPHVDPPEPESEVSITMSTRDNCGWCRKWKQEVLPSVRAAGHGFQEQIAGGSVPRFDIFVGGSNRSHTGFLDLDELNEIIRSMGG